MKIVVIALIWVFVSTPSSTIAQNAIVDPSVRNASTKLIEKFPSVYISFDNTELITSKASLNKYEVAWFRLHNNTRFVLRFCAYDTSISRTGKPGIHYEIEKVWNYSDTGLPSPPILVSSFPATDLCTYQSLESGKAFLFGVQKAEILTENSRLRIRFQFPWESERDVLLGNEVEHFVYFYPSNFK